jgi:hypothetical protein
MIDLSNLSDDELNTELERRKKSDIAMPQPLPSPSWGALLNTCRDYLIDLRDQGWADDDYPHYIYEAALTAIYGDSVWPFINKARR